MDGQRILHDGRFFCVTFDPKARLCVVVRTRDPFESVEQLDRVLVALEDLLDDIGREGVRLLVDLRAPTGRNDEPFERAMRNHRPRILAGFERVGIIVRSVIGALQVQRYAREEGTDGVISTDLGTVLRTLELDSVPAGLPEVCDTPALGMRG